MIRKTRPVGLVTITIKNTGKHPHSSTLAQLNDGVGLDDFNKAMSQGPNTVLAMVHLLGGRDIAPGESLRVIYDLQAGAFFVADLAGEQPMIVPLVVKADTNAVI